MGDWLSYTPSDFLLFSARTYYRLFELYNRAIWPAQILALLSGLVVLWRLHRPGAWQGAVVATILAAGWLWTAWAYLVEHFDTINWAARYFAVAFVVEALLLTWAGVVRDRLAFQPDSHWTGRTGMGLVLFALVVHPLIGPLVGRSWTQAEIFGVTPDPTALATLGVLLTVDKRPRSSLMIIPLIWCAISGATLWTMAPPDFWVMPVATLGALGLAVYRVSSARGQGTG
ncbi:DUF6064 family protein [Microvirga makkahensis]|uniref:MFS transporter permease n=1 Tax=Microvirga makkahensis TaxID=1128670 RepID=A0A7X3MSJ0_9HYPH|nr:DUF6064 family protein [Microvirga makkahensis]MXQ12205.1 MFS transporter permease [Microvirga makkahensis]